MSAAPAKRAADGLPAPDSAADGIGRMRATAIAAHHLYPLLARRRSLVAAADARLAQARAAAQARSVK